MPFHPEATHHHFHNILVIRSEVTKSSLHSMGGEGGLSKNCGLLKKKKKPAQTCYFKYILVRYLSGKTK